MAKIVDPDSLVRDTEIVFDTTAKTIRLLVAGNLHDSSPGQTSGVTLQAVYSKCKELWKAEVDLNKLKFPFDAITEAKMDLVNGWRWHGTQTRELIRDGGWSQRNAAGLSMEEYATIISLGSFAEVTDQATFQRIVGFGQGVAGFDKTGVLNEAIRTFSEGTAAAGIPIDVVATAKTFTRTDAGSFITDGFVVGQTIVTRGFTNAGNNTTKVIEAITATIITVTSTAGLVDETGSGDERVFHEFRDFLKTYLRVAPGDPVDPKLYSQYNLLAEQGLAVLDYTVYRLPLSNAADIKITKTDAFIDANAPYTGMTISYFRGKGFSTWATDTAYAVDDVVQELIGTPKRWFRATSAGTSTGTDVQSDTGVTWEAYPGERLIGASWFAFNRIIDGNVGVAEQTYEFAQRELRRTGNINDNVGSEGFGTVNGVVAVPLLGFLGDTLQTNPGLFIDDFHPNDTNRIDFFDITVGTIDSGLVTINVVAAAKTYTRDAGGSGSFIADGFVAGQTVVLSGFTNAGNNGSKVIETVTATVLTMTVATGLVNESGDANERALFTQPAGVGLDSESKPLTTTKRIFPFVSAGTIVFNQDLLDDANVKWTMYFLDLPGALDYDTVDAMIVDDKDGADIAGTNPSAPVSFTFDYDGNVQGGRTPATDAEVVIAAIGLSGAQFVAATFTITRATGLTFPVNAAKERNYSNP